MIKNLVNLQCFFGNPLGLQVIDKDTKLSVAVMTAVPPFVTESKKMVEVLLAFDTGLRQQKRLIVGGNPVNIDEFGDKVTVYYNLQNPPLDFFTEEVLAWFKSSGVISTQIAYAGPNRYGGGFLAPDVPLTEDGKQFVRNLAKVGMALDLSHAGHKTCRDALNLIEEERLDLAVFASHTGTTEAYDHNRNLTRDILERISGMGGVVGLFCVTFFLDGADNSEDSFLRHMEYLIQDVGVCSLAIGTDTPATFFEQEQWKKDTEAMKAKLDPKGLMGIRHPDYIPEFVHPRQMERIYEVIEDEYGPTFAAMICGRNALRFLKRIVR